MPDTWSTDKYTITDSQHNIPTLANLIETGIPEAVNFAISLALTVVKEVFGQGNHVYVGKDRNGTLVEVDFGPWQKPKTTVATPVSK